MKTEPSRRRALALVAVVTGTLVLILPVHAQTPLVV